MCALLLAGCSEAQPEVRRYTIEQFLDTERISGGAFSPDEETLLYSSDASGVYNAYAVPVAGGEPVQLTHSTDESIRVISYFPADGRILYGSDRGGNEIFHIYVREEDGSVKDLTPGERARTMFFDWSDDDQSFFYTSNAREARAMDLYEMSIDGYEARMVFQNDDGYLFGAVSGDKRYLALEKERTGHNRDLYLYDMRSKSVKHLTPHTGDVRYHAEDFGPDGAGLYVRTNLDSEFLYLARVDLKSGATEVVEQPEWGVMFTELSRTGKYLAVGINNDARTEVKILDTANGKTVSMPELPLGDITSVKFSRSETKMHFRHGGSRSPANLYVYHLDSGEHRRLTDTLSAELDPEDLAEAEVVRYPSFDGLEIPAILLKPRLGPGEKAPALLDVHGGPGGQSRVGYNALDQYLVNQGYVILRVNNRGSSGYGKTFYRLDDHKHGQDDLMDCVKAKDFLIGTGYVDEERIGILGGSYGGYMVLAARAFQPDAFAVGVDIFGVANWVRTLKSIPPWWTATRDALYQELGNPETEEEYLRRISPLFHADRINKPLIVLQGANDPRVLQVESDEIVEAVRKNGVPVEYLVFDDEGHGFSKKANRIEGYRAIRRFLDEQ
ncbi:MAG: S9 family peptidase, partial [bacterium]|nr:S9 family peptidase [bacterium]